MNGTQVILGLIPAQNQFLLNVLSPVILPGLKELADASMEEFTAGQVMFDILYGNKQLYMIYLDQTGTVKPENFQENFANRLQEPAKDYVGFAIIMPLREAGFHVFAGYVIPEHRRNNVAILAAQFLEGEARKMGAPYISTATSELYAAGPEKIGYTRTTVNLRKKLTKE